jgi:putative MFS transporter
LGSFCFALLVDRVGRKPLFIGGFIAGGIALLALCVLGATNPLTLVVFVAIGAFFMNAVSTGLNLYTPELYPTRVRAIGSAVGSVWQRVAAGTGPLVVAVLAADGLRSVFAYFGALAILGGLVAFAFATETKGRTLEQLSP